MRALTVTFGCLLAWAAAVRPGQVRLPSVDRFEDAPVPFEAVDWRAASLAFDEYIFGSRPTECGFKWPLIGSVGSGADGTFFGIASYAGDKRLFGQPSESFPVMGALYGGAASGAPRRPIATVEAATLAYYTDEGVFNNRAGGTSGKSFWYDILPALFASSIADLYPESEALRAALVGSAARWSDAAQAMRYDFNHTAFAFANMTPYDNGRWVEADAAAGVAYLALMASRVAAPGDPKSADDLVATAINATAALEATAFNPLYEAVLPFGALAAARLNAEHGSRFNVTRIVEWCLDGSAAVRVGWGSVAARWGGVTVDGLVGSLTDGGGYAFFGNTVWYASVFAPLVRYDVRFADAIGKWLTHAAVGSRLFFPGALGDRQSGPREWLQCDPLGLIGYEGLRKCDWSRPDGGCLHGPEWGPFGTGQNCGDFGVAAGSGRCEYNATDRSMYGGAFVGVLGALVSPRRAPPVLQFDLNALDSFAGKAYPTALLYNPTNESISVEVDGTAAARRFGPGARVDVYEATEDTVVSVAATVDDMRVNVGPLRAALLVFLPTGAHVERNAGTGRVTVGDVTIRFPYPPMQT